MSAKNTPRHDPDSLRAEIQKGLDIGLSFRAIAQLQPFQAAEVPAGTLCSFHKGADMPKLYRRRLNMNAPNYRYASSVMSADLFAKLESARAELGLSRAEFTRLALERLLEENTNDE